MHFVADSPIGWGKQETGSQPRHHAEWSDAGDSNLPGRKHRAGMQVREHALLLASRGFYAFGSVSSAVGDCAHKLPDQFSAHLTEAAGAGALLTGRTADADHVRTSRPKAGQFLQAERGQELFTALDAGRPDLARKGS